ncbi:chromosome partitioning protein, ParB family, partial [Jannaschia aquimarina]
TTFAKLKKKEKAEKLANLFASETTRGAYGLTDDQCARIAAWTPDGMV